jgi:Family of unknown function (DUF6220)
MTSVLRQVNAWVAWAFVAALLIQVWLAGAAIPQLGGNGSFVTHVEFGYLIGLFSLILVVLAILARSGRRRILQAAGILGLYVVQSSLPYMDPGLPAAAALHPVNAVAMIGLAIWYASQVWRERARVALA